MTAHGERVKALGLDVYDPEDNVKFAHILYEESGWIPWVCARGEYLAFVN